MDFHEGLLDLFLVHFRNVDDFHDVLFFIFLVFNQNRIPETSLPDHIDLSIFLHSDFKVKPLILYYKYKFSHFDFRCIFFKIRK